jgi:hypothetical protein
MTIKTNIHGLLCRINYCGAGIWCVECNGRTAYIAMPDNGLASEFHEKIKKEFEKK